MELIFVGASENTKVISFTVTKAGYYLNHKLELQIDNEFIKEDLKGGNKTIYVTIYKILEMRSLNKASKVTLLCFINVRDNGKHFKVGLEQFLKLLNREDLISYL